MSNDPSNMSLEIELGQLQQLLASALERLQAVNAKLKLDASPPQEQSEQQVAQFRGDIERTCLSCASLLRELERLRHRVIGAAPNGAFGSNEISPEIWQW